MRPGPYFRLMLSSLLFSAVITSADTHTDWAPLLLGQWQCQSSLATLYGQGLMIGDTLFAAGGQVTGSGTLLLSYPGMAAELPFAGNVSARWQLIGDALQIEQIDGNLVTAYPILNSLAETLKAQVLQQPAFKAKLIRLNSRIMALKAEDGTDIQCIRA